MIAKTAKSLLAVAITSAALLTPYFCVKAQQIIPTSTREEVLAKGITIDSSDLTGTPDASRSRYGEYAKAVVREVKTETASKDNGFSQRIKYRLEILNGTHRGQWLATTVNLAGAKISPEVGDRIVVYVQPGENQNTSTVFLESYDRLRLMYGLLFLLAIAFLFLAGTYGLRLFSSVVAMTVIGMFSLVPLYLRGWPPALCFSISALIAAAVVSVLALGWAKRSAMATLAGWLGSCIAYAIIFVAADWARLNPVLDGASIQFFRDNPTLDQTAVTSLGAAWFFAALATSLALTVVDGVARVKQLNPLWGFKEAFAAGMTLARDFLAVTVPIPLSAAAGLGFLALLARQQSEAPWVAYLNSNGVANLSIPVLAGTLGLALAVPAICATAAAYWSDAAKRFDPMRRAQSWRPDSGQEDRGAN